MLCLTFLLKSLYHILNTCKSHRNSTAPDDNIPYIKKKLHMTPKFTALATNRRHHQSKRYCVENLYQHLRIDEILMTLKHEQGIPVILRKKKRKITTLSQPLGKTYDQQIRFNDVYALPASDRGSTLPLSSKDKTNNFAAHRRHSSSYGNLSH